VVDLLLWVITSGLRHGVLNEERRKEVPPEVFFFSFFEWGETESTWYVGHCWPIVPAPDDR
jgi:hypothetical protein